MSDSQTVDYFDIAHSLLSSRRQWQQVPEVVPLTLKAIVHLLESHHDSFQEHKTLINQQSLKIKEVDLRMGGKLGKKQFEAEINNYIRSNSFFSKKEDDVMSQYEKLVKESRYEKDRQDQTTTEEIKTISQIICDNKIGSFQKKLQTKILAQRLQFEQKLMSMKQQLKYRFLLSEKDLRQMKQTIGDNKAATNFLRQSQNRSMASNSEQKINSLEVSSKRLTESINHIIQHIQNNYLTKQQLLKIIQNLKSNKEKSPGKSRVKEDGRSKSLKDSDTDMAKLIQPFLAKQKNSIDRQWQDFKQSVYRQLGQTVKVDTVNNLIDRFQKEILEKISSVSSLVHKLESKIHNNQQIPSRQILIKSQKRAEKKVSPSKLTEQIHGKINKIQKTVTQQRSDSKRLQLQMQEQIQAFDKKLIKQLDRRQRKMCEVIEQTCNRTLQGNNENYQKDSLSQVRSGLQKVFQTNIFCRYLYLGTVQCKKDMNIVWQKEVLNNLVQNFIWKQDSIYINARGLYRLQVGLFSEKLETQTHLMLNDQIIAILQKPIFINNPSKKAKGCYFHEFLMIPAKSKISIRVSQHFYGQAVLSIQQL